MPPERKGTKMDNMKDLSITKKLDLAEALLKSLLPGWNLEREICDACGYDHQITWEDFMCHQLTGAAITRIQRIRRELRKPAEETVSARIAKGVVRH